MEKKHLDVDAYPKEPQVADLRSIHINNSVRRNPRDEYRGVLPVKPTRDGWTGTRRAREN